MVSIIPFLPTFRWYAAWLSERWKGVDEVSATAIANTVAGIQGKDFARAVIGGNAGKNLLSVPVAGGSNSLKKAERLPKIRIADHGNWRHVHLGAFEAAYGRMPFYPHLITEIKRCYAAETAFLSDFNHLLHQALCSILFPTGLRMPAILPEAAAERGRELLKEVAQEKSMIETLFRFGSESILPLMADQQK
ncbi:MAG: WbqC family protein [Muribaculaceae bacterium]|nr:WbqC family protein [Muribaculaceae bacterium]